MPDRRPGPLVLAAKTYNRVRTRGPTEVAGLARARLRDWVSSGDELILLARTTGGEAPEHDSLTFTEATERDAGRYALDIGTDSPWTFRRRLSDRTTCFLVISAGRIVHATWATTGGAWTRELRRYLVPPPGDAYVYESFTRAEARGMGAYPFALAHIANVLGERGRSRVWVGVEAHNRPSLRAVSKAGFEEGFRLRYSRRFGRLTLTPPSGPLASLGERFLRRRADGAFEQGEP